MMNRRRLIQAGVAVMLFAVWTSIVRSGISDGSRDSAWLGFYPFDEWPDEVHDVRATSDIKLSIFATYASGGATSGLDETIPDLFGHPVIGSDIDNFDSGSINGSRFTTGIRAGELASISGFVAGPVDEPPNDQFQLAIYEDSNGAPGRRLATTASGRLAPDAWNTLAIRAVLQPRTAYWLMYTSNGSNGVVNNLTYTPVVGSLLDNAFRRSAVNSNPPARLVRAADRATSPGDIRPMVVAIVIISLFAATRRPRAGIVLLAGFAVALFIAWAVREAIFEPFGGYPSGHALRATYVGVALWVVTTSRLVRLAACTFVAIICLGAVYTGNHYSEEIIGGILLGWGIATLARGVAGGSTRTPPDPGTDSDLGRPGRDSSGVVDISDDAVKPATFDR